MKTTNQIIHDNLSCWDCSFSYKKKKDPNKKWYSEEEIKNIGKKLLEFINKECKKESKYKNFDLGTMMTYDYYILKFFELKDLEKEIYGD
jgi:hypothetical protein